MKTYQERKEEIRGEAIDWLFGFAGQTYTWGELAAWNAYFEKMGKRYGLLKEFRAEGIC